MRQVLDFFSDTDTDLSVREKLKIIAGTLMAPDEEDSLIAASFGGDYWTSGIRETAEIAETSPRRPRKRKS